MKAPLTGSLLMIACGLEFMLLSILFPARKINLALAGCIIWFFIGFEVSFFIAKRIVKDKLVIFDRSDMGYILYFSNFIVLLYWYNPHHITISSAFFPIGLLFNCAVMNANNGKMPALSRHIITDTNTYIAMSRKGVNKTRFNVLGDWIPTPFNYLSSPGDILMEMGPLATGIEILWFF